MSSDEWFRRRRIRLPFFDIDIPSFYSGDLIDMLRELERRMDEALRDLGERVPEKLTREKRLPDGRVIKEFGPFIYGYSVTIGPDGKPVVREFGNLKPIPGRPGLTVKEAREPLTEVIENDEVKVIVEIPGVEKEDIQIYASDNKLTISVDSRGKSYHKVVEIPKDVEPEKATTTYRNGVLEITLPRKKEEKKGFRIKVE
ncbi:MAG: archaeal heat shock protein Hsp20 [Nitrososphaerales archaeon]